MATGGSLLIHGGRRLGGEVTVSGNKNAALPMIAASLLTDEAVTLRNVPEIGDVAVMLEIAASLGVSVDRAGPTVRLCAAGLSGTEIPRPLSDRIRTAMLFAGPLLARLGRATFWPPGGDVIGRRRLDAHFYGLRGLGATLKSELAPYRLDAAGLQGRELFFDEASVTATEHILMAACLARGRTVIMNAAAEPHVQDLAVLLGKMGAEIEGIGTNTLTVNGVTRLHGAEHTVVGDHIEAGSFLVMAAATGGELTVNGIVPRHCWMLRRVCERFGVQFEMGGERIHLPGGQRLAVRADIGNAIPVIDDGPWPQFPTDLMSCTLVMATRARGTVLFFEKMFESRMYFVDRLIQMGANAVVCDPHRVVISGPARLRGIEMSSPDIRAGMALVIAALCARGRSVIHHADVIGRGYADVVGKIAALGGRIETRP
jgi:UDP-N-acetylglucosamine 1-carboxyvinyltransferase